MAPPCATCPNAPKTPTEWFQSLGVATQPLLILIVVSSVVINVLEQIIATPTFLQPSSGSVASMILSSVVFLPRSLLDYSPVISISFLFKMLLLTGLLDRVEKQVCGEYLPSIMEFSGRRLFTPSELANGGQAMNRDYLVRSLRLLWVYVLIGSCISCVSVSSAIFSGIWGGLVSPVFNVLFGGGGQQQVPIYDGGGEEGGMMMMTTGWRSRVFYASESIPLALMFLLGMMLPNERMALPSFLSGMISKATTSCNVNSNRQRGFATGQNMNTYDQYQASQEKSKGYRVVQVALVYMALDLLFFGSGWVCTISALVVGGGIGTALSKEYDRMIWSGTNNITLSEWRGITPPMVVNVVVDLFMTKVVGLFVVGGLAKLFAFVKQKFEGNNNVPVKMMDATARMQVVLEAAESYYSTKWVFRPHEQLDVPNIVHQTIRQRNLRKFDKLKASGARTPWAKQK